MTKFVNKNIRRFCAVGRYSAIQTEYSSTTVSARVGQDLHEFIRRELRNLTHGAVFESQNVTLGTESVVRCADRRREMHAGRGARDSRLQRRRAQTPYVEIRFVLFERRRREQDVQKAPRVTLEFAAIGRGLPGHSNGSTTTRSRLNISCDALPEW